jgi:monoamine oxidase
MASTTSLPVDIDKKDESNDTTANNTRVKFAIVGAGASGLRCANLLIREHGYDAQDILILEARDRIGGRIRTTRETRVTVSGENAEFSLDHGAAWVHGTGLDWAIAPVTGNKNAIPEPNPMMELLEEATPHGESLYEKHLKPIFSGNPWMRPQEIAHKAGEVSLYVEGRRLEKDSPIISEALTRYFSLLEEVSEFGDDLYDRGMGVETTQQSLQGAIEKVQTQAKFQTQLRDFSESDRSAIKGLTGFYLDMIGCWEGASTSDLQLCQFTNDSDDEVETDEAYTEEGDFYGPHCTLTHGMETLLEPLLKHGVRERIRLNEEVSKIRDQDGLIVLDISEGRTVNADYCVVTMPIGCLKEAIGSKRLFQPELSDDKLEAIRAISMGSYKKVFLTFDHIFWPADEAILGMVRKTTETNVDDPLGNYLLFDNLWARDGIPCIEAVLVGAVGNHFSHKSDDVIRDAVLDFMQDAMGLETDIRELCTDCHATRWEEDPFSRGAYSHLGLGALPRNVVELSRAEWDGRLVFCGEATIEEYEGSVHAALFSGKNAAESLHSHAIAHPKMLPGKIEAADQKSCVANRGNTLLVDRIHAL